MVGFVIGTIFGAMVGVVIMALVQINGDDHQNDGF